LQFNSFRINAVAAAWNGPTLFLKFLNLLLSKQGALLAMSRLVLVLCFSAICAFTFGRVILSVPVLAEDSNAAQVPSSCLASGGKLDLQCFIANDPDAKRIRAEEAAIESSDLALARSGTLDPAHKIQTLGSLEIYDPNLSVHNNLACGFCHDPAAGFGNGSSALSVYAGGSNPGSVAINVAGAYPINRIAKRNPQSYVYSPYFAPLHYNKSQQDFYGGNFWDGRATGYKLQNAAAEQAQDPPTDPEEMANPDPACVVWKLSLSQYRFFFEQIFGDGSLNIQWPADVAQICGTPKGSAIFGNNATPLDLTPSSRTRAMQAYDEFGQSIAAYESSDSVSSFTSKFDYYLALKANLSAEEMEGYNLFRGKAKCNTCHFDGRSNTAGGASDSGAATSVAPLFTDTTYNNLGLPKNLRLPWYNENTPDQYGFTGNPAGFDFIDTGVGLFLGGYYGAPPDASWEALKPQFDGKFQTSTVRDVAKVPYPGFVKAFMHNGYLTSMKQLVHFYNTRDVYPFSVTSGHCPSGTIEKVTC
jgi:cytochrome c peroxidase